VSDDKRDGIRLALEALQNTHGQLSPDLVVDAARDPGSPLHAEFEWDTEKAAHAHRIEQARTLIRSVRVEIHTTEHLIKTVRYVHDPRAEGEQGYVDITRVRGAEGVAEAALGAEVSRVKSAFMRGLGVAASLEREGEYRDAVREFTAG
jgi:hypothetical protein